MVSYTSLKDRFKWPLLNAKPTHSISLIFPDIDECDKSLGPNGKCGANALCSNSPGGFSCACQAGYTGDPYVNCYGAFKYESD